MFRRVASILSMTAILVWLTASAVAQTSQLIPFRGTAPGQPDGPTDLTFKLYDAETSGTYLNYSDSQSGVNVSGEAFNTVLGLGSPLSPDLFINNSSVYIAIELTSVPGTEIAPRVPLYSTGFAQFAHRANTAQTAVSAQTFDPGAAVSGSLSGASLSVSNTDTASGIGITAQSSSSGGAAGLFINSAGDLLQGKTNPVSAPVFRLFNNGGAYFSGNVGIGTADPLAKLHVNGNAFFAGVGLGNFGVEVGTGGELNVDSSGGGIPPVTLGGRLKVALNGNVGIGTPNPAAKLHVAGNTTITGNTTIAGNVAIGTGVASNGGGFKHRRFRLTGVTPGSHVYQLNWPTPFPDANYTIIAVVEDLNPNLGTQLHLIDVLRKTATGFQVFVENNSAFTKDADLHVIAIHD